MRPAHLLLRNSDLRAGYSDNAMPYTLKDLFLKNKTWAGERVAEDPDYFRRLVKQQKPDYLWIGCADSRVPANEILGLPPGEVFVHRNIANVVAHTDFNCLSVMQFAVDMLKVKHVMVVGHYGCSGVHTALHQGRVGLADNWLRHVRDIFDLHQVRLEQIEDPVLRHDRLCELNAIEQVRHVAQTSIVEDAWQRGQELTLHAWVYGLKDGLLRDLGMTVRSSQELESVYRAAVTALFEN
ncbi:carbonic anhydrase [Solimonas aquatica]|uniref:Carbonic anhydrase 2 n=2 Tax=Solimonas aquatica TaxID=489703 RepID=A0A1H9ET65_9GAMM|nr:carbonic anhydrase [Solimonas aquatica]